MINVTEEILKVHLDGNMKVFKHHLYEYEKGLRDLILHTTDPQFIDEMIRMLEKKRVPYFAKTAGSNKVNLFFGDQTCIDVLKCIGKDKLSQLTEEEDFILGIMLGYDRKQQCERYLKRKSEFALSFAGKDQVFRSFSINDVVRV